MLQVRYEALLSKADPHCAVALLGEVPPWGVILSRSHACSCGILSSLAAGCFYPVGLRRGFVGHLWTLEVVWLVPLGVLDC
jgi:hypothetical protein